MIFEKLDIKDFIKKDIVLDSIEHKFIKNTDKKEQEKKATDIFKISVAPPPPEMTPSELNKIMEEREEREKKERKQEKCSVCGESADAVLDGVLYCKKHLPRDADEDKKLIKNYKDYKETRKKEDLTKELQGMAEKTKYLGRDKLFHSIEDVKRLLFQPLYRRRFEKAVKNLNQLLNRHLYDHRLPTYDELLDNYVEKVFAAITSDIINQYDHMDKESCRSLIVGAAEKRVLSDNMAFGK